MAKAVATLACIAFLGAVIMGLVKLSEPLRASVSGIINSIPASAAKVALWIETLLANYPDIEPTVLSLYNQGVEKLVSWLQTTTDILPNIEKVITSIFASIMGIINLVKNVLIGIIVMVYLLNIKETLAAQGRRSSTVCFLCLWLTRW